MGGKSQSSGSQQAQTQRQAYEDTNTLASRATARIVEVLSEGEIEGFATSPVTDSIYFGDTPLSVNGVYNFNGVGVAYAYGTPDQSSLQGFPNVETATIVDALVTKYSPKYSGSGDGSVSRSITDTTTTAVRVTIRIPELYYIVPDYEALGKPVLEIVDSGPRRQIYPGDIIAADLTVRITITDSLSEYRYITQTIYGKTMSAYERSWRFELHGTGPWTVTVAREYEASVNLDWMAPYYRNELHFASFTEIKDHKLTYPDTAVVGLTIDSQTFGGSVDQRSYLIKGIKCQIPDNYDPITRTYTGVWAGTFTTAWTDNPAWVLYDILINTRYGLALTAAQVDKWGLFAIGQYADEYIPDGFGGLEPRYTCNGVINSRQEGFTLAQAIASIFRGQLYWKSGVIYAVADMPSDPVKLVTNANVIDGQFNYVGTSLKSRHTAAIVTYNDPNDLYRQAPVLVEDQNGIIENGYNQLDIAAFMCTSKGQAYRQGLWALDTEKTETELVTYKAALDHADLLPGDLISLADNSYMGVRWGGRIRTAIAKDSIRIDKPVTLANGVTYTLSAIMPDGTIESSTITNLPGEYSILNLSAEYSEKPISNALFTVSSASVSARLFRVLSIREQDGITFEVTALFHDPTKYDRIEQYRNLEGPSYTGYPSGLIAPVTGADTREYLYLSGTTPTAAVTLSWNPSPDPRTYRYEVFYRRDEGPWIRQGTTTSPTIDITPITDGWYKFQVTPVDSLGKRGASVEIRRYLQALEAPPASISTFRVGVRGETATLTWTPVNDVDLSHYTIRYSPSLTGVTWGSAAILKSIVKGTEYKTPALAGTYLIKAVDTSGTESVTAKTLIISAEYLQDLNVVETITEHPGFSGEKVDVIVDSNDLILDSDGGDYYSIGTYYFAANPVDLGETFTSRIIPELSVYGDDAVFTLETWPALDDITDIFSSGASGWQAYVEQRTTENIPGPTDWTKKNDDIADNGIHTRVVYHNGKLFNIAGCYEFAGTYSNTRVIYSSDDYGETWTEITPTGTYFPARGQHALFSYDDKLWVVGGLQLASNGTVSALFDDVWYSDDDGETWTEVTTVGTKWAANRFGAWDVFDGKMWVFIGGESWYSTDGATWTEVTPTGDTGWTTATDYLMSSAVVDGVIYLATQDSPNFLLYSSVDGEEWAQDYNLPSSHPGRLHSAGEGDVLAFTWKEALGSSKGTDISIDGGETWTSYYSVSSGGPDFESARYFNTALMPDSQVATVNAPSNSSGASNCWVSILPYPAEWSEWEAPEVGTDYQARGYEFRAILQTDFPKSVTPRIQSLSVEIDMPDRIESAEDVAVGAGGETIVFTAPFRAIPAVAVTGQDLATGDYAVISKKSVSGFTIQFKNAGGSGVARTADWIARGYGRQE